MAAGIAIAAAAANRWVYRAEMVKVAQLLADAVRPTRTRVSIVGASDLETSFLVNDGTAHRWRV